MVDIKLIKTNIIFYLSEMIEKGSSIPLNIIWETGERNRRRCETANGNGGSRARLGPPNLLPANSCTKHERWAPLEIKTEDSHTIILYQKSNIRNLNQAGVSVDVLVQDAPDSFVRDRIAWWLIKSLLTPF
jgi:hypothetical protein